MSSIGKFKDLEKASIPELREIEKKLINEIQFDEILEEEAKDDTYIQSPLP